MFEQILQVVKEHMSSNPQLAESIPPEHMDAVHQEIATHIHENLQGQNATPDTQGAAGGGILSTIENSLASGNIATSAIAGGLVGGLASKFCLPAAGTRANAAAVTGLLQKV